LTELNVPGQQACAARRAFKQAVLSSNLYLASMSGLPAERVLEKITLNHL
jgi:hypothetical protein